MIILYSTYRFYQINEYRLMLLLVQNVINQQLHMSSHLLMNKYHILYHCVVFEVKQMSTLNQVLQIQSVVLATNE